jgi:zinc protease
MLCFRGGSLLDPVGQEGLSVVCARQLLNGTRAKGRDELTEAIERLGSELSLVTQPHYLAVSAPALTRALPDLLPLLTEALCEPALDEEEIERTARTYAAELEATWDDDGYLAWQWLSRRLFRDHPLWRRASMTPEGVRALNAEMVRAHWAKLFHRDALLTCASGSVEREALEALINPLREALPQREGASLPSARELLPPLKPLEHGRLTLVSKEERRQAHVLLAQPSLPYEHPDSWAFRLGVAALGGTFSSPLMQEVRVKRGLSYGASASVRGEGASATLTLNATPEGKDATETLKVMFDVLQEAKDKGLSEGDVAHAKSYLTNAHPFRLETPAMRAALIARAELQGVPVEHELETPRLIEGISTEQVNEALSRHLKPEAMEAVVLSAPKHLLSLKQARTGSLKGRFEALSEVRADDDPEAC